jgi:hypothetical protein
MSLIPLYVYAPQKLAFRALLEEASLFPASRWGLMAVHGAHHLAGLDRGTFGIVKGHPVPVPNDILDMVRLTGMNVIEMSDEFARAKAALRFADPGHAGVAMAQNMHPDARIVQKTRPSV